MNRRLKTLVASVCVATSLISGMAVSAFAEDVKYTLKSGDTVVAVCQSLGIDFYKNKDWITKKNNIKDYSRLKVGQTIILPGSGTTPTAPSITDGTAASGSAGDAILKGEDFISGYLISHTMASGETVGGVCATLGIDFASNSDRIMKLNNISSWNKVAAGKVIQLPTTKAPASGSCIKIVAHKIVAGDTAYAICQSYGISYDKSLDMMKILNNKEDFAAIKAGQLLYLPVPGTISSGSGGNNVTVGGGTNTPTQAQQYDISTQISNGTVRLQVNNNSVTKAKAGDTIKIVANPEPGSKLDSITVYKAGDTSKTVEVDENNCFKMPEYSVVVKVVFNTLQP